MRMELGVFKSGARWPLALLLAMFAIGAECLRNVSIEIIPEQVAVGGTVTIACNYILEGADLYAMKLYKGRAEFYRYIPSSEPNIHIFPLLGINVDLSESNANRVVLKGVNSRLSGEFNCEVSEDAPTFSTSVVTKQLLVATLPTQKPMLHLRQAKYEVGNLLVANCTAAPSRPAAKLTFFINEIPVPQSVTRAYRPRIEISSQQDSSELALESSSLGLEIRLQSSHIRPGRINRLYCQQRVLDLSVHNSEPFILYSPPITPSPPTPSPPPKEETIAEPVPERVTSPNQSSISTKHMQLPVLLTLGVFLHHITKLLTVR